MTVPGIVVLSAVMPSESSSTQETAKHLEDSRACCCLVAAGFCALLGRYKGHLMLALLGCSDQPRTTLLTHSTEAGTGTLVEGARWTACTTVTNPNKTLPQHSPAVIFSQLPQPS